MPRDAPVTRAILSASGFDIAITKSDHDFSAIEPREIRCWPGKLLLWLLPFLPERRFTSISPNSRRGLHSMINHCCASGSPHISAVLRCRRRLQLLVFSLGSWRGGRQGFGRGLPARSV